MEPVTLAIIASMGWVGILAKNYSAEMIKIAIEREKKEHENDQEELQRTRRQFDIIFQNLLTRVNEERDTIQASLIELKIAILHSAEIGRLVTAELIEVKKALASSSNWTGEERRKTSSEN